MSDIYLETSALVRSLLEGDLELAKAFNGFDRVVASRLTFIESDRAFLHARLSGRISGAAAKAADSGLNLLRARSTIVALDESIAVRASGEFRVEPVRTLDAVHLATALLGREAFGLFTIASCDRRVRSNAEALGFKLVP